MSFASGSLGRRSRSLLEVAGCRSTFQRTSYRSSQFGGRRSRSLCQSTSCTVGSSSSPVHSMGRGLFLFWLFGMEGGRREWIFFFSGCWLARTPRKNNMTHMFPQLNSQRSRFKPEAWLVACFNPSDQRALFLREAPTGSLGIKQVSTCNPFSGSFKESMGQVPARMPGVIKSPSAVLTPRAERVL